MEYEDSDDEVFVGKTISEKVADTFFDLQFTPFQELRKRAALNVRKDQSKKSEGLQGEVFQVTKGRSSDIFSEDVDSLMAELGESDELDAAIPLSPITKAPLTVEQLGGATVPQMSEQREQLEERLNRLRSQWSDGSVFTNISKTIAARDKDAKEKEETLDVFFEEKRKYLDKVKEQRQQLTQTALNKESTLPLSHSGNSRSSSLNSSASRSFSSSSFLSKSVGPSDKENQAVNKNGAVLTTSLRLPSSRHSFFSSTKG